MAEAEHRLIRNYTLRMPETLAQRLETHARNEGRSLHAEILYHLERAIPDTMIELPADVRVITPAGSSPETRVSPHASGGTFTLTMAGTSEVLPYDATVADVEDAIERMTDRSRKMP